MNSIAIQYCWAAVGPQQALCEAVQGTVFRILKKKKFLGSGKTMVKKKYLRNSFPGQKIGNKGFQNSKNNKSSSLSFTGQKVLLGKEYN